MYRNLIQKEMCDFLIVYGTQTGQAKAIAEEITDRANDEFNLKPRMFCTDEWEKKFWLEKEHCLVIVISSTGDGDPPENATKFVRKLNSTVYPDGLKSLRFALLGLGDSNYSTFLGCPKLVEKKLLDLSATSFYQTGFADDATGLEEVVEPWIDGFFPVLKQCLENIAARHSQSHILGSAVQSNTSPVVASLTAQFNCILKLNDNNNKENENEDCNELTKCTCIWPNDQASLVKGGEVIREEKELRVPVASEPYLSLKFTHEDVDLSTIPWQNACPMSGTVGPIHSVPVLSHKQLSATDAKKDKFELMIDIEGTEMCYLPGDAMYFIFENSEPEVEYILKRLKLSAVADNRCEISIKSDTKKEKSSVPEHLPLVSTLRHLLSTCVDIRRTPGRPILRILAEYCSDDNERRRLLELCSSQGVKEFTVFVRQAGLSVADLLHAFPSCLPPPERLLEQLPRLLPRPYSMASSTLTSHDKTRFVYSVLKTPKGEGKFYDRVGLCSQWLINRKAGDKISVILKEPCRFRFPENASNIPLIMIGPGTGVAPFLGFLEHLKAQDESNGVKCNDIERWLMFGCRDWKIDFIYKDEMVSHYRIGTLTNLVLCESRPNKLDHSVPKYVQDAVKNEAKKLSRLLIEKSECGQQAKIFVCGDAKAMSKDVFDAFVKILVENEDMSEMDARNYLMAMKSQNRYLEDVWS